MAVPSQVFDYEARGRKIMKFSKEIEEIGKKRGWTDEKIAETINLGRNLLDELGVEDTSITKINDLIQIIMPKVSGDKYRRIANSIEAFSVAIFPQTVTQEQLETDWIPRALREFKQIMPPIDRPEPKFYFVTEDTRTEIIREVNAEIQAVVHLHEDVEYDYVHGKSRDAIIIHMYNIEYEPIEEDYQWFARGVYAFLGRLYAINSEQEEWYENYEFEKRPKNPQCYGYIIWKLFAMEAISKFISDRVFKAPPKMLPLKDAFVGTYINFYPLGTYFVNCHNDVEDQIFTAPIEAQPFLKKMRALFEIQKEKEQFWITDDDFLKELGTLFKKMTKALRKDDSNLVEQKRRSKRKAQKQARKKNR